MFTLWVQHADFSTDEFGEITCEKAVAIFRDWREHRKTQSLKRPADPMPLLIGFNGEGDSSLNVSAFGNGYNV